MIIQTQGFCLSLQRPTSTLSSGAPNLKAFLLRAVMGVGEGAWDYLARLLPLLANLPGNSRAQPPGASGRGAVQPARVI